MSDDLLLLFQKMGTTDHDVLIKQFRTVVDGVDDETCRFFLEANNWTLQHAITSFFDYGRPNKVSQNIVRPKMNFISETEDGKPKIAGTAFVKRWRIQNTGTDKWPEDCSIEFIGGERMGRPSSQRIPGLAPSTFHDITLSFIAPIKPGNYAGSWMLCANIKGMPVMFGEPIWVIISVEAGTVNPFGTVPGVLLGTSNATPSSMVHPLFGTPAVMTPPSSLFPTANNPSSFGQQPQTTPFNFSNQGESPFAQFDPNPPNMDM
eukprot:TRINITY_DN2439_c0_g1_i1.p1 TRINITY_DN2439_c0_g1~~TRINITY_DN2439_c0_g1_i1.p1  ORF type:complete len:284 (-),score=51.28 TRINITY_DN2439_c0_g1_i1:24-809(-)